MEVAFLREYRKGRRHGSGRQDRTISDPLYFATTPTPAFTTMMTYDEARDTLVTQLRQDAAAHDTEQYDAVGRRFDAIEHKFPTGTVPELGKLHIALTFWDGWVHARNHGFPPGPIGMTEWPVLARAVADDLEANRDLTSEKVLEHFDIVAHPRLDERVQILAARLREQRVD